MLVHMQCNAELDGMVDDAGRVVYRCPTCGACWTAEFVAKEAGRTAVPALAAEPESRLDTLVALHTKLF